jgi:hypothetical protein
MIMEFFFFTLLFFSLLGVVRNGHIPNVADGSDVLFNKGIYNLDIFHIPSGQNVDFKAYIKSFSDDYSSTWNEEPVYGRMDPIVTFQGTQRKINVTWAVVAGSPDEAKFNLAKCSRLITFLYPSYDSKGGGGATTISASPLLKVKFANLIADLGVPGASAEVGGLVCASSGFSYAPNFDHGVYNEGGMIYPIEVELSTTLTILHTHPLGWSGVLDRTVQGAVEGVAQDTRDFPYPYGVDDPRHVAEVVHGPQAPANRSGADEREDEADGVMMLDQELDADSDRSG